MNCRWCRDTGWITVIDYDGSGYDTPCPQGCTPAVDDDIAVPY